MIAKKLKETADKFIKIPHRKDIAEPYSYPAVASSVYELVSAIALAEKGGLSREEARHILRDVRTLHQDSPFAHRLQTWPRGYAGDFETIEHLVTQDNKAPVGTYGHWLEATALNCGVAQQHRNKVRYQADLMLQAVRDGQLSKQPAKILSIASGSSPDIRQIQAFVKNSEFKLVLNDIDPDALAFATGKLNEIDDRVYCVPGNTLRRISKLAAEGPFDLVVAGGLFDYLDESAAKFLIRNVYERLLAPGGTFMFTNIAAGNPYRHWLEYCTDWFLIERSEADVDDLLNGSGAKGAQKRIFRDPTRLTIVAEVLRT